MSVVQKLYDQKKWMLLVSTYGQQAIAAEATMMDLVKSKCLIGLEVVNVSASTKKEWNRQVAWGERFLSKLQNNSELQAFMFTHELFGSF